MTSREYLAKLLLRSPLSWAIIRAQECQLLEKINFTPPILEVGCGDGLVSQVILRGRKNSIDVGIDIDGEELRRAQKTGIFKKLVQADITAAPFPENSFSTVFANGVLEHIPNLEKALSEISRILNKKGQLITTSPTQNFGKFLIYFRILSSLHLKPPAILYENFINRIFHHYHLYNQKKWQQLLSQAGLKVVDFTYYNNPAVIALHDLTFPLALPSKLFKHFTDQMVFFPSLRRAVMPAILPLVNRLTSTTDASYKNNASILLIAEK